MKVNDKTFNVCDLIFKKSCWWAAVQYYEQQLRGGPDVFVSPRSAADNFLLAGIEGIKIVRPVWVCPPFSNSAREGKFPKNGNNE